MTAAPADERIDKSGFALLKGENLEVYVKKYVIELGRRSKSATLDVVLGDNMNLSRQHAQILFDFEKGHWCISVLGKNGVSVNGKHYGPPERCPLASQDLINMGEQSFWFLLPRQQGASAAGSKRKKAATSRAKTPAEGSAKRKAPSKVKAPAAMASLRTSPSDAAAQQQSHQPNTSTSEPDPTSSRILDSLQHSAGVDGQSNQGPPPIAYNGMHQPQQQINSGSSGEQHLMQQHDHHPPE
ncbi:hypothetical protein WJX74_005980 [Apatococcus lobatus]|uniref:FHA domain-containing protein n=1 Tax=Apatococcus lobatus TaxID=904363 RepID=A0AAW1RS64_9CHLO